MNNQTRISVFAAAIAATFALKPAVAGDWQVQIGGLGPEIVFDTVETDEGRLCATGTFSNDADFGADDSKVTLRAGDIQDIFVACYEADGRLAYASQFGGGISDEPRAVAALPGGDIVVTGFFSGSITAGGARLSASGGADIFLVRLDRDGKAVWAHSFGGRYGDNGNALAVTPAGEILLGGSFQDVMFWRDGESTRKLASRGGHDAFVMHLDAQGEIRWAQSFGGRGRDATRGVVAIADGGIAIAGVFEREARVPGSNVSLSAAGGSDAFVIAFDADGSPAWSQQVAGPQREYLAGLQADDDGNIYVAGNFQETVQVGDGHSLASAGSTDVFLYSLTDAGNVRWAERIGSPQVDEVFDIVIDRTGDVLLSGHYQGDVVFETGRRLKVTTAGNADGFILAYRNDGRFRTALSAVGDGVETAFTLTPLAAGGVLSGGFFNKAVKVDTFTNLRKRGKTDIFLVRLGAERFRAQALRETRVSAPAEGR